MVQFLTKDVADIRNRLTQLQIERFVAATGMQELGQAMADATARDAALRGRESSPRVVPGSRREMSREMERDT